MLTRKVQDGEWVRPAMQNYIMECCGCGLMHRMDFRVSDDGGIEMRGVRLDPFQAKWVQERLKQGKPPYTDEES